MTALLEVPVPALIDGEPFRLIVTGSRDWHEPGVVWNELLTVWASDVAEGQPLIVVHGCALGADSAARSWALGMKRHGYPVDEEGHRPDYERYGPQRAPLVRNTEMVGLGASLTLAFCLACRKPGCRMRRTHITHGTADCSKKARAAGIEVRRIEGRNG